MFLVALTATAGAAGALSGSPRATIEVANLGSSSVTPIDGTTGVAGKPIGFHGLLPVAVVFAPDGATAFVVAVGSDSVGSPGSLFAVTTATGVLSRPITVGTSPQAVVVSPNGRAAYVLNGIDAATTPSTRPVTVTPIDTTNDTARTAIDVGTLPREMVLSPNGSLLYVLDQSTSDDGQPTEITPVDTATLTARAAIRVAASSLAFAPDSRTAYALSSQSGVVPIDTATGAPGKATSLLPSVGVAIAVTPDATALEVLGAPDPALSGASPDRDDWTLTSLDAATGRVAKVVDLGVVSTSSDGSIALAPDGETAYALLESGSQTSPSVLVRVDLRSGRVDGRLRVGDGIALAVAPGGATVYVLQEGGYATAGSGGQSRGAVLPVSAASLRARPPIVAGVSPQAFAIAPASAG